MTDPPASAAALARELADSADLIELVRTFRADLSERLAAIEKRFAEQRLDELARLAHQLKGAAGGYGFRQITDIAGRLES